ncbi:MAG TPA: enoate reductase, partial [Spirochaetales bacterium]|nr:enoate reductase [Spirochaetales bacterium]
MKTTHERVAELVESVGTWYEKPGCLAAGRMSAELYPYTAMFSPIRVNRLTIKNRLVMAPMGNVSMADETGRPSAKMIEYFTA